MQKKSRSRYTYEGWLAHAGLASEGRAVPSISEDFQTAVSSIPPLPLDSTRPVGVFPLPCADGGLSATQHVSAFATKGVPCRGRPFPGALGRTGASRRLPVHAARLVTSRLASMDVYVVPRPPPAKVPGARGQPRRSTTRRRRRESGKAGRETAAPTAATDGWDDADALHDASTTVHAWAPTWAPEPGDRAATPKSAPRAPAVPTPRGWQGPHLSAAGERKLGLLEAAVVAASQRQEDRLRKNNNAGATQVPAVLRSRSWHAFLLCE